MSNRSTSAVSVVALLVIVFSWGLPALAAPGWGNEMWFKPGTTNINGTLFLYKNDVYHSEMRAGSGMGNQFTTCQTNQGRLPNGWYNTGNEHHVHNKNGSEIDGRVWGLQDKNCGNGTIRTALFVHTEETVTNGQNCPNNSTDDKHCWETAAWDYRSAGCIKISHPNNGFPNHVNSLNSWWHNQVGGGNGVSYSRVLWVGATAPPTPPN